MDPEKKKLLDSTIESLDKCRQNLDTIMYSDPELPDDWYDRLSDAQTYICRCLEKLGL